MINVFGSKVGQEEIDQIADSINNQWMGMGQKRLKQKWRKDSIRINLYWWIVVPMDFIWR